MNEDESKVIIVRDIEFVSDGNYAYLNIDKCEKWLVEIDLNNLYKMKEWVEEAIEDWGAEQ